MPIPVAPVLYSLQVNGQQINTIPLDIELRMSWGMHDLWFIRMAAPMSSPRKHSLPVWPQNAAVRIVWGRGGSNMSTWYGYVHHHRFHTEEDSGAAALQITYVLMGTSKPLNSTKSRSWQNLTPEAIAAQIAAEARLRCIATPTGWGLDNETQASMSDFRFLNELGDKVGRRFWVSGGTMYFIDPAVLLAPTTTRYVPQYRIDKQTGLQDSAREFKLMNGDQLPGSELATRSIYGFDQSGNVIVGQAGSGQLQLTDTTRVARSAGEAQNLARASQARAQFWLQACVEVFGHTMLYPGKLIHLAGDALLDQAQGYWIVTGVRHLLVSSRTGVPMLDQYVTRVEIIRNTENQAPDLTGIHQVRPEIVACTLRNGAWEADRRGLFYDARVAA